MEEAELELQHRDEIIHQVGTSVLSSDLEVRTFSEIVFLFKVKCEISTSFSFVI